MFNVWGCTKASSLSRRLLKPSLALAGVLAISGRASAQELPPTWQEAGSDTLFEVMTDAFAAWRNADPATGGGGVCRISPATVCATDADCGANGPCVPALLYKGGGSGTAETAMQNTGATGDKQCIGPMSRNFKSAVTAAHPTWAPTERNVLGLDAAVFVEANTATHARNIALPTSGNAAAANTSPAGFVLFQPGSGYTQLMEIILAGTDGSGSVAACSDPRRINAIADLAAMQGTPSGTINHFYRRDDNSGTTDTIKEKLQIKRFCNGAARGVLGSNAANPNLNNQDLDPIRRPCEAPRAGWKATACTDVTTGRACSASDNNPNCTQGLVVALSIGDVVTDVTVSIGQRVAADFDSFGFAGREGDVLVDQASAPYVNTNPPSNSLVRLNAYLLSRRLFLQFAASAVGGGTCTTPPAPLTGVGGASRVAAEERFYDWATSPDNFGRCNMDPIMIARGYIACTDDCTAPFPAGNLCNGPYEAAASTTAACIPYAAAGGPVWNYGQVACTAGSICCSTNAACPASGFCPAANGRPADAACSSNSECASGVCDDVYGLGIAIKTCM